MHQTLQIYAGGLGILAGDYLKSASDLGLPVVGVGLLYRQGYFQQQLRWLARRELSRATVRSIALRAGARRK